MIRMEIDEEGFKSSSEDGEDFVVICYSCRDTAEPYHDILEILTLVTYTANGKI